MLRNEDNAHAVGFQPLPQLISDLLG